MICHKCDSGSKDFCIKALKEKKVIIIPTDTVYGFSGIYDSEVAEHIREIKGRSENKPFIQLISNPDKIKEYTDDKIPEEILNYWPGPLTVIVNDKRLKGCKNSTTAFRCPGDLWLREILSVIDVPVFSTSLNRSGKDVLYKEDDIISEFSEEAQVIVLDGNKENAQPSTIITCINDEIKVIRQGALEIKL